MGRRGRLALQWPLLRLARAALTDLYLFSVSLALPKMPGWKRLSKEAIRAAPQRLVQGLPSIRCTWDGFAL